MSKYFISYDLRNGRNYDEMYQELKKFNAIQVLESLYCFKYETGKSSALRDHFKKIIDSDDGLIIIESYSWASFNVDNTPNKL